MGLISAVNTGSLFAVLQASASYLSRPGTGLQSSFSQLPLSTSHLKQFQTTLPGVDRPRVRLWQNRQTSGTSDFQNDVTIGGRDNKLKSTYEWRVARSRLEQTVIIKATTHLKIIVGLESQDAEANSLYEYLSYQILSTITLDDSQELFDEMLQIFSGPHSLNDLVSIVEKADLDSQFKFHVTDLESENISVRRSMLRLEAMEIPDSVKVTLTCFLKTLEYKRLAQSGPAIIDSPAYDLGYDYLIETFDKAMENPEQRELVLQAIMICAANPFPLLTIHRLFHLLLSPHYYRKIPEFFFLPWLPKTAPNELLIDLAAGSFSQHGSIETGFVDHPALDPLIRNLLSVRSTRDEDMEELSTRWSDRVAAWIDSTKTAGRATLDNSVIADFVEFRSSRDSVVLSLYTKQLATELREGHLQILSLSADQLKVFWEWRYQRDPELATSPGVTFLTADGADFNTTADLNKWLATRPDIVLPEIDTRYPAIILPEVTFTSSETHNAYLMLETVTSILHEFVHLMQNQQYGTSWIDANIFEAEIWAYGVDVLFQLIQGDQRHYNYFSRLSPISIGFGLRNAVEQRFDRKMMPPK